MSLLQRKNYTIVTIHMQKIVPELVITLTSKLPVRKKKNLFGSLPDTVAGLYYKKPSKERSTISVGR